MMNVLAKLGRKFVLIVCAVLIIAGVVGNLCCTPQTQETISEQQPLKSEMQQTHDAMKSTEDVAAMQEVNTAQELENRLAAMRMQRDISWQQLYQVVEQLEFGEKQQILHQYAELQYKEQRLELLISAKGIDACIAVLETEQANIIVPENALQTEYEKIYDLVLRNTDYDESQIILVPLK